MSFSFLFEMTWKSALITGAALMLVALLRHRAPADRAAVLRLGVALLLLLPLIALFLPALQVEMAAEDAQPLPFEALLAMSAAAPVEIAPLEPVPVTIWDDPSSLIGIAYLGGLLMVALRIVGGLLTLGRWTRRAEPVLDAAWLTAFDRARPERGVGADARLLVSDEAPSPLSWGWRKPVVLIDRDTLDRAEDADGILAHEMAHLVRRDWLALMMTRISVALFWFNPLVWLLEREVVQQAEEAADAAALGCVEPAHYAQTLVSCAQLSRGAALPANSISPRRGGLGRRVSAILDGRNSRVRSGSLWTLAAMLGCAGFAAPLAAIELVPALTAVAAAPPAPPAPVTPVALPAPLASLAALSPVPAAAPVPPAPPASPAATADGEIVVPAVDVDVPGQVIDVPETTVSEDGVRVRVPAMRISVPRVQVTMAEMRVRMPQTPVIAPTPAVWGLGALGHPHMSDEDRAEMQRDIREAMEDARREAGQARQEAAEATAEARREALAGAAEGRAEARSHARNSVVIRRDVQRAQREAQRAMRTARLDISHGARGMEQGADGMIRGARDRATEADRLRNADYRERQIAKAAAEGRTLTHRELLDAIPKLREGSKNMLAGAERMRDAAARMRRESSN